MASGNGKVSSAQELGRAAQSRTRFGQDDSDVAVVVGSGAGGGTLANELCQQGIRTVVLEAGPHLTADDYVQDECAALNMMAWLDARTTSGSWRDLGGEPRGQSRGRPGGDAAKRRSQP